MTAPPRGQGAGRQRGREGSGSSRTAAGASTAAEAAARDVTSAGMVGASRTRVRGRGDADGAETRRTSARHSTSGYCKLQNASHTGFKWGPMAYIFSSIFTAAA